MKQHKWLQTAVAVMLMLSLFLSACSKKSDNTTSGTSSPSSSSAASASAASVKPKEKVKLVYAGWNGVWAQNNKKIVERFYQKYPDSNIEIEVKEFPGGADYNKAMDVSFASNEVYDIMLLHKDDVAQRADKGVFLDFTPYGKADNFDFVENYGEMMKPLNMNGKTYLLPYTTNIDMLYYNKDMFDAANLKYPDENTTWDDIADMAKKLTKGDGASKVYGFSHQNYISDITLVPIVNNGWDMMKDAFTPNFLDPRVKTAITRSKNLMDNGYAPTLANYKLEKLDARLLFAQQKAAIITGSWWAPVLWSQMKFNSGALGADALNFKYGATFAPKWDSASKPKMNNVFVAYGFAANAKTKHPKEAYQFIKFMTTECIDILNGLPAYTKASDAAFNDIYNKFVDDKGVSHNNLYPQSFVDEIKKVVKESKPITSDFPPQAVDPSASAAIKDLFNREGELFFLGKTGVDDFIKKVQDEGTKEGAKFKK